MISLVYLHDKDGERIKAVKLRKERGECTGNLKSFSTP